MQKGNLETEVFRLSDMVLKGGVCVGGVLVGLFLSLSTSNF